MKTTNSAQKPEEISLDDIRSITVGKPDEDGADGADGGACDIRRPDDCDD